MVLGLRAGGENTTRGSKLQIRGYQSCQRWSLWCGEWSPALDSHNVFSLQWLCGLKIHPFVHKEDHHTVPLVYPQALKVRWDLWRILVWHWLGWFSGSCPKTQAWAGTCHKANQTVLLHPFVCWCVLADGRNVSWLIAAADRLPCCRLTVLRRLLFTLPNE